jgi:hypothetical protein
MRLLQQMREAVACLYDETICLQRPGFLCRRQRGDDHTRGSQVMDLTSQITLKSHATPEDEEKERRMKH